MTFDCQDVIQECPNTIGLSVHEVCRIPQYCVHSMAIFTYAERYFSLKPLSPDPGTILEMLFSVVTAVQYGTPMVFSLD